MQHSRAPAEPNYARAKDSPSALACSWTTGGMDAAWVHVAGALDMATAPQLERALSEPQSQAQLIVLDLQELEFIDSAGLHAIVDAGVRARTMGRRLILLRGRSDIGRIFSLIGSADELEIGDAEPAGPPARTPQRSLVSLSLLRTDK